MGYSLCGIIDTILAEKPGDYETFLQKLEQQGYEVKRGKYTSVKGKGQKRFIRFRTLGTGYGEDRKHSVRRERQNTSHIRSSRPKNNPSSCWWTFREKWQRAKVSATKSGQRSST